MLQLLLHAHRPLITNRPRELLPMSADGSILPSIQMITDSSTQKALDSEEALCTFDEHTAMKAIGGDSASTYGEITPSGFQVLGKRLRLGPDDTFVDCGSGLGSVVEQAAYDFGVAQAIGVEYAQSRHALAQRRLLEQPLDADTASRIRLLQGDCADEVSWAPGGELSGCTCAYICNLLFDDALNARLKRCVETCEPIERVAVFKPWQGGLVGFGEPDVLRCQTSWAADPTEVFGVEMGDGGTLVYVYERRSSLLPSWWSGEIEGMIIALAGVMVFSAIAGDAGA